VKLIVIIFFLLFFNDAQTKPIPIVSVLEAPIFARPDINAKIVDYSYKGHEIYLHPAHFNETDNDVTDPENYNQNFPDPLLQSWTSPYEFPLFYKTLDKTGNDAYILREHVYIFYGDVRELSEKFPDFDATDYRLSEPLPENYPLYIDTGYRNTLILNLIKTNLTHYDYTEKVVNQNAPYTRQFIASWSKQLTFDKTGRLYFGYLGAVSQSQQQFILETKDATEENLRLSLGSTLTYDIWKTQKNLLNVNLSMFINILDQVTITQTDASGKNTEEQTFSALTVTPTIGIHYNQRKLINSWDVLVGTNALFNLPRDFKGQKNQDFAMFNDSNTYQRKFSLELSFLIGIQKEY
jgi:hypothetical protein